MDDQSDDEYGVGKIPGSAAIVAPMLDYRPRDPQRYRPAIGVIGCGGISVYHLAAYQRAGYRVAALCDIRESQARERRDAYYPDASVYTDYRDLLRRDDIEIVDVLTHPAERAPIVEAALQAYKHTLSQKPFVLDLDLGERLAALAERQGVRLAVNQNGRWAPHFAYLRSAVDAGILGDLTNAVLTVHWDHSWVVGTSFEDIHDLILYDFAIHWFDIVTCFFGDQTARRVTASTARAVHQRARPPLLAHVMIEYEAAQATLAFDASVVYGQKDHAYLAGSRGSALSEGPGYADAHRVTLYTVEGHGSPALEGSWFQDGFHGAMAELLCAIEEGRAPLHNARDTLRGLALAFAAIASAHEGTPQVPGAVRRLPASH